MTTIQNRFTGEVIVEGDCPLKELVEKNKSNLRWSDLSGSNLSESDLRGSKIEFFQFPSIRLLSSMPLSRLSDALILELMRRDAYGHPHPEQFDAWAEGGACPYQDEERMWHFRESRELWKPGNPEMTDRDLVIAICKEKGWGIRGYLNIKEAP